MIYRGFNPWLWKFGVVKNLKNAGLINLGADVVALDAMPHIATIFAHRLISSSG